MKHELLNIIPLHGICLLILIRFKNPKHKKRFARTMGYIEIELRSIQEKNVMHKALK
tara:strand:- start:450 stop:620 length:171 start_codon:yes stop_codon:yes gene_type:complete